MPHRGPAGVVRAAQSPPDSDAEAVADEVARLYPTVYRRISAAQRPLGGVGNLTPRMHAVLLHVLRAGSITVGELAEALDISKATATELVSRVESRHLLERSRDSRDRRRVHLSLTPEGRRKAEDGSADTSPDDVLLSAVRRMTPADRTRLVTGLRAVLEAMQDGDEG